MSDKIKTAVIFILILSNCQIKAFAQNINNGGFENWIYNTAGMPEPENWETQNEPELVFVESSEGHTGLHSACLNVVWDNMMQKFTGASMNTVEDISVNSKFEFLRGYCKGSSNNTDTLKINISLYSKNKLVGVGSSGFIQTSNEWTQFAVSINYYSDKVPEKAKISISVIPVNGSHHQTTYCIDDLIFSEKTN